MPKRKKISPYWAASPADEAEYRATLAAAQAAADASGFDHGVERHALGWHFFVLPRREHRCGHELRCVVVSPTDLSRCRPGHGPACGRLCSDRAGVIRW